MAQEMKRALREYRRLKKLVRVLDGDLSDEAITRFLDEVDEQVLSELGVGNNRLKELRESEARDQANLLAPYFEKLMHKQKDDRLAEKLEMAERIGETIKANARFRRGSVLLPYEQMLMLALKNPLYFIQLDTSCFTSCLSPPVNLENEDAAFLYPTLRLRYVLKSLDDAKIKWDKQANELKVYQDQNGHSSEFVLYCQDLHDAYHKPTFTLSISTPVPTSSPVSAPTSSFSITDLIFMAVESMIR